MSTEIVNEVENQIVEKEEVNPKDALKKVEEVKAQLQEAKENGTETNGAAEEKKEEQNGNHTNGNGHVEETNGKTEEEKIEELPKDDDVVEVKAVEEEKVEEKADVEQTVVVEKEAEKEAETEEVSDDPPAKKVKV